MVSSIIRKIKRDRSQLFLVAYDNSLPYTVSVSSITARLIKDGYSGVGNDAIWTQSKYYRHLLSAFFATVDPVNAICDYVDSLNNFLWLGLNKFMRESFKGDELDYCAACDLNFNPTHNTRTPLGFAENQLKYHQHEITQVQKRAFGNTIMEPLVELTRHIPTIHDNCLVTVIPHSKDSSKLAYFAGKHIADKFDLDFIDPELSCQKPKFKKLCIDEKINEWRNIYGNGFVHFSGEIAGKNILIIDDLYQSGASTWCLGEYLKSLGAATVSAVSIVKSMKDSDNVN